MRVPATVCPASIRFAASTTSRHSQLVWIGPSSTAESLSLRSWKTNSDRSPRLTTPRSWSGVADAKRATFSRPAGLNPEGGGGFGLRLASRSEQRQTEHERHRTRGGAGRFSTGGIRCCVRHGTPREMGNVLGGLNATVRRNGVSRIFRTVFPTSVRAFPLQISTRNCTVPIWITSPDCSTRFWPGCSRERFTKVPFKLFRSSTKSVPRS